VLAASLALGALLVAGGPTPATAGTTSIAIVDVPRPEPRWGFTPATRNVVPGTWVTWSNDGQDAHTVTAVDESFDSGNLNPSEGFSWYFASPGTFAYLCAVHPWMTGSVVVVESEEPLPDDDGQTSE
jgi:plastocyanin